MTAGPAPRIAPVVPRASPDTPVQTSFAVQNPEQCDLPPHRNPAI